MKTLYLECSMGAAGDMLTAALLELIPDRDAFLQKMNALGLADTNVSAERVNRLGITGTQMHVTVHGEEESHEAHHETHHHHGAHHHDAPHHGEHHHHSSMSDIEKTVADMPVSERVRAEVLKVYGMIAEAESHVHGRPVTEIHFHEVGTKDAVADITAVCLLMEQLAPEKVIVSPVHVGSGHVHCAHGILPVPAPATAYILRDVPVYSGHIQGELCTPTGAALLKNFADAFGNMPLMRVQKIGYGFGKKEFPQANCVRAFLGESDAPAEEIRELVCNLDDMTGEALGFSQETLLQSGALDVFTSPVMMKKGRPGVQLTVLCRPEQLTEMLRLIFRHTSTLGVREHICPRYALERTEITRETPLGTVRVKQAGGFGTAREKAEYDDLAAIARANEMTLEQVKDIACRNQTESE